jgi:hypothetical protein
MVDQERLRAALSERAPTLWLALSTAAAQWTAPIVERLKNAKPGRRFPKTINDPIWGSIEVMPCETMLLDSPLLQRLRGVRQLGMAHYVYPGAGHCRLEHTLGVLEAADRMYRALERNAEHRARFGQDADEPIPPPSNLDRVSIRFAALLHDVGHGPFSHVTEAILQERYAREFEAAKEILRDHLAGVTKISTSETIAVLLVLSEPMRCVLEHPRLEAVAESHQLAPAIAAHVLGSRSCLTATYLSGVISGPLDADKLDYMARDSYHAGLPLGLGINRLISKLEVVTITPENAPNAQLKARAEDSPNRRFHEIGISLAGLGAYEQMIIGRVVLYDRVYYHHKVRAAESMLKRLIKIAEEERGSPVDILELLQTNPDENLVAVLAGHLKSDFVPSGKGRAGATGFAIATRRLHHRAYTFAARFVAGLQELQDEEKKETLQLIWNPVLNALDSQAGCDELACLIYEKAVELARGLPDFRRQVEGFLPEHVLVDLPLNRVVAWGGDIPMRTEGGHISRPNLFFDPERWSQAYEEQRQCGFVFAPAEYVELVALASRVVFYERFAITMGAAAHHASKTSEAVRTEWVRQAGDAGVCSHECLVALTDDKPRLARICAAHVKVPERWIQLDPGLPRRIAHSFDEAMPGGLPGTVLRAIVDALDHLLAFVEVAEESGLFVGKETLSEKELQGHLKNHLRSRGVRVTEGAEVGGGETDLILPGSIVVENKVRDTTADPLEAGPHYPWQARRYSIAVCTRVAFIVVAYRPSDERAVLPQNMRVAVSAPPGVPEGYAQVRIAIPWGHVRPSGARAPRT